MLRLKLGPSGTAQTDRRAPLTPKRPADDPAPALPTIDTVPIYGPEYQAAKQRVATLTASRDRIAKAIRQIRENAEPDQEELTALILDGTVSADPTGEVAPLEKLQAHYTALVEALRRASVEVDQARKTAARGLAEIVRPEYQRRIDEVEQARLALLIAQHDVHGFLLEQDSMVALELHGMTFGADDYERESAAIDALLRKRGA